MRNNAIYLVSGEFVTPCIKKNKFLYLYLKLFLRLRMESITFVLKIIFTIKINSKETRRCLLCNNVKVALTLGTGTGIGEGLDGRQIRIDGTRVTLIAAATGGRAGRDGTSREWSTAVSAPSVVPSRV